jgi:hypothetical protein
MKSIAPVCLLVLAPLAAGCMGASDSAAGVGRSDAGVAYSGGAGGMAAGSGGSTGWKADAGTFPASDASATQDGSREAVPSNLTGDAASFNWDTYSCPGCGAVGGTPSSGTQGSGGGPGGSGSGGGSRGGGGASAPGGGSGAAGTTSSGGRSGSGGSIGLGGFSGPGGSSALGGSTSATGAGGSSGRDAGSLPSADATPPRDGNISGSDLPPFSPDLRAAEAGGAVDGGAIYLPDTGADSRGSDVVDTQPACVAQIVPLVPALARLNRLVAGPNTKVVLRAEVVSGALPSGIPWSWEETWESSLLSPAAIGQQDPAAALFVIANPGTYTFRATAGACQATVSGYAVAANACGPCDSSVIVRAAPPATIAVPVQAGSMTLLGVSPFDQNNIILSPGVPVLVAPSAGSRMVNSYVRINDLQGGLVVDGLADPRAGGLAAQLLALDSNRSVLKYDVLVVPFDGSDGETAGATAPQLFQGLEPSSINGSFPLVGGVTLTGSTVASAGQPVSDVRVMLSNQDPTSAQQRPDLLFSSVGRSDAQGSYTLHVQKGTYWASFSPPPGMGLAEALGTAAVTIAGDASLAFQWDRATTATLALIVVDAVGVALPGVSVRLSSFQSRSVGTLTLTSAGGAVVRQPANGNVQIEGTTDTAGAIVFPGLPADAAYDLLLVPATQGAYAATTTTSLMLGAGGTSTVVQLRPQATIHGQLSVRASGAPALDFASVKIVAYDRSVDSPEAPRAMMAAPDGSFAFGATPGRPYVLLAVPGVGSGYARTFVGPGPVEASEFVITQPLLGSMEWRAAVMDERQYGLAETALQIFCDVSWPNCVDPAVPLAETTSDANGFFDLALPDPSSR